jgi:hypothetical protein
LQEVNEEREAKLVVALVWRGAAGIGGVPARSSRWPGMGFLLLVSFVEWKKRNREAWRGRRGPARGDKEGQVRARLVEVVRCDIDRVKLTLAACVLGEKDEERSVSACERVRWPWAEVGCQDGWAKWPEGEGRWAERWMVQEKRGEIEIRQIQNFANILFLQIK